MPPVTRRIHRSICVSLLNAFPTDWAPKAIRTANRITGSPVPKPYIAGRVMLEPHFTDRGIRLPKKSAAEIGQKESAKTIPKSPPPQIPNNSTRFCIFSLKPEPGILNRISSSKIIPTKTSIGPSILFMYFCRICDTCGIDKMLVTRRIPRTTYVNIRPNV